jgi:ketosteroid isomerase-like protein
MKPSRSAPLRSASPIARVALAALAALVLGGLGACPGARTAAPAQPPAPPPTAGEVVTAVKARVEQYRQGYEVRSLEALEPLYAHDDGLVVTSQGRTQRGWPQAKERLAGFLAQCQTMKLRLTDVVVVALGDGGAMVTAAVHRTYGDGTRTVDEVGTILLVFRRQGGEFFIVAEHFSYGAP